MGLGVDVGINRINRKHHPYRKLRIRNHNQYT
jgi:hypothetical protein